jgi:transketolase
MLRAMPEQDLEQLCVNVIRGLAMDGPQNAHAGHPGTAMALAPLAHVLYTRIMRHDPSAPGWPDRDRFILSAGHASILQYSLLFLCGYGLTIEDLQSFRQWGSRTPGHPEVGETPGIEVTTGPLGQGIGNSVGMAMAERFLRARFGAERCDHHVYTICSDGDFMEGISHEAGSLAGHLGLGRLIAVYDDNHITIDGPTELSYTDDVPGRFRAYGWDVDEVGEIANDLDALEAAVRRAQTIEDKPSLIVLRSHIGWPSPHKTDTKEAHGEPLGEDEVRETKEILGLPADETFYAPAEVLDFYRRATAAGATSRAEWEERCRAAGDSDGFEAALRGRPLPGWAAKLPTFEAGKALATRRAINTCVNATAEVVPGLVAGAADLTGNTGVALKDAEIQDLGHPAGSQVHFGIREHGMAASMTGMALHGGVLPVGGTFFVFSDYMRPSVRLASLSHAHVVYFWSHDSVGLGEDGPTHQPIEHLASLRAMPGLRLIRPADANECAQAWRIAVESDGPTGLVLTRQDVPILAETAERAAEGVGLGAYVLRRTGEGERPDLVLVASGSEVQHCLGAADELSAEGHDVQVVSMPSWDLFEAADAGHRSATLPRGVPTLAVEAASPFGWERYADAVHGIDHYGASASGQVNMEKFGFTAADVASRARELLGEGTR